MGTKILVDATLREVIASLDELSEEDFIFATGRPNWTRDSRAYVVRIPNFTDLKKSKLRADYFLEVFVAREVIENCRAIRGGRELSLEEKCDALVFYAINDSYLHSQLRKRAKKGGKGKGDIVL